MGQSYGRNELELRGYGEITRFKSTVEQIGDCGGDPLAPFGCIQQTFVPTINLRVGKTFPLAKERAIEAAFDVLNVGNATTVRDISSMDLFGKGDGFVAASPTEGRCNFSLLGRPMRSISFSIGQTLKENSIANEST